MRAATAYGPGCAGAGGPGPAMERIPRDGGCGSTPPAMSGMRRPGGEDGAVAFQGAVQQALRGSRGVGVRERVGTSSGTTDGTGGEHGTSHGSAVFGTMGSEAAAGPAATDGSGRNLPGQEGQVPDGGMQSGNGRAAVVWPGAQEGEPEGFFRRQVGRREGKEETLDDFFRSQLVSRQRKRLEAVCVDMWDPFRLSIEQWAPQCKIVYDKFHIMQHANDAIDELRLAEFFRQGKKKRGLIKGKKWLLMSRWKNLTGIQRGELNRLFQLNRRVFKAYMLKESLERLWNYRYRGAMLNYLTQWMDQLKWQRLAPFE